MTYGTVNADVIATSTPQGILGAGDASIMKNRIINGAMVIDQRNSGASVTPTTDGAYTLDRFKARLTQTSKFSVQQNSGSVTPPTGFSNYLGVTSLSSYSVGASDFFAIQQNIEGFNIADLGWGTANAKTVTLSFQVYSSLIGTFGGTLYNNGNTQNYQFSYSIPVANTWTTISITIVGSTSGTWLTNSGIGIQIAFSLGCGSTYTGGGASWGSSFYFQPSGAVSVVGTSGATFYITDAQLEVGSSATGFEYRQYQQELALCQRYYAKTYDIATVPGTVTYNGSITFRVGTTEYFAYSGYFTFPVSMRTDPSIIIYAPGTGAVGYGTNNSSGNFSAATTQPTGTSGVNIQANNAVTNAVTSNYAHVVVSAEL